MTPELEKQIASLIEAARSAGSDAATFIGQQAPEVIQQMLMWEFIKWCCLSICIFAAIGGCLLAIKKLKELENDEYGIYPPPAVAILAAVALAPFAIGSALEAVKIKVAPKVVIMEKVKELVGKR